MEKPAGSIREEEKGIDLGGREKSESGVTQVDRRKRKGHRDKDVKECERECDSDNEGFRPCRFGPGD